jgi:nucleosome assembly protein 1-like 1
MLTILGMDIRAKVRGVASDADFVGPTPNNTPVQPAPIAARVVSERPSVSGIIEEAEDEEPTTSGSGLSSLSSHPFAGNQRLINMLQGKLGSLLGRSSGYVESLPEPIRRRINGLKYLQKKHTELESEFHKEILELEKKYLNLYRPLYEKRTKIILGQLEPTDEEVEAGRSDDEEEKEGEAPAVTVDVPTDAGIPEFWLTTLKNHGALGEMITEEDEEPLKKLRDIRMEYLEDRPVSKDVLI